MDHLKGFLAIFAVLMAFVFAALNDNSCDEMEFVVTKNGSMLKNNSLVSLGDVLTINCLSNEEGLLGMYINGASMTPTNNYIVNETGPLNFTCILITKHHYAYCDLVLHVPSEGLTTPMTSSTETQSDTSRINGQEDSTISKLEEKLDAILPTISKLEERLDAIFRILTGILILLSLPSVFISVAIGVCIWKREQICAFLNSSKYGKMGPNSDENGEPGESIPLNPLIGADQDDQQNNE